MSARRFLARLALIAAAVCGLGRGLAHSQSLPGAAAYTMVDASFLTANWTAGGNPPGTQYEAQISVTPDFSGAVITISPVTTVFADFTGLAVNTTYYGQVRVAGGTFVALGPVVTLPNMPAAAATSMIKATALTANWTANGNPAGTWYEVQAAAFPDFTGAITHVTQDLSSTFIGLGLGTQYSLRVRALNSAGVPTAYTALANAATLASLPAPSGAPDYYNYPNYANSPLPTVDGGVIAGGIKKFVDTLPGLGAANQNNLGQFIPVATPDQTTYPDADYYQIGLGDFTQKMHSDLSPTKLRSYKDLNAGGDGQPHYLGPLIIARKDRPVRIKFTNQLGLGTAGDLFIPVDQTVMGAGMGPDGANNFAQNRATLHLHGGDSPWISDGTPHQWITPAGDPTAFPKGASQQNVPDMADPGAGASTFFWPNQHSGKLMFYHDHSHGITRLNVYAGEAAGYLLTDPAEEGLINDGVLPNLSDASPLYRYGVPLIIQDKTFVPSTNQLLTQDPTWDTTKWGGPGNLWLPHVYMPAQDPSNLVDGTNPYGRWDYGPWDPMAPAAVTNGPTGNIPGTPNPSIVPEAFMDTPVVNGTAYPKLQVARRAYRFRILNAANDRSLNLQLYKVDPANPTEVKMVPAVVTTGFPADWPTDGRDGGVPDPDLMGPSIIRLGTEGGLLSAPVAIANQPITYDANGNMDKHGLLLMPAERADIVVDFSSLNPGDKVILYNDAPAPAPGGDPRYDYYTGNPDQSAAGGAPSTLPGYGPNMRTIMLFEATAAGGPGFAMPSQATWDAYYNAGQNPPVVSPWDPGATPPVGIADASLSVAGTPVAIQGKSVSAGYDLTYGRLIANQGVETGLGDARTFIPYGYSDPATEVFKNGETQLWRIVNNDVDSHPIHFHLFNVQVVNRIAFNPPPALPGPGTKIAPEPQERGWKETVRINPFEDVIVALRPVASTVPFTLPDSVRYLDPTLPPGSMMGLSQVAPDGSARTVTNVLTNFGSEYTWHCHILGHEEFDLMRPMILQIPPGPPSFVTAEPGDAQAIVAFVTPPTGGSPISGYTVTATPANLANPIVTATGPSSPIVVTGLLNSEAYTFAVVAENAVSTGPASLLAGPVTPEPAPTAAAYANLAATGLSANWTLGVLPPDDTFLAQLSTAPDFSGTVLSSTTLNLFADFAALAANTTYYGRVRVELPSVSPFTYLGPVVTLAYAPAAAAVGEIEDEEITAHWTANGNPVGTVYEARVSTASDFTGVVTTSATLSLAARFVALEINTTYYLQVRAVNHGGVPTGDTPLGSVMTLPSIPLAAAYTGVGETGLSAHWTANGNRAGTAYEARLATVADFSAIAASSTTFDTAATFAGLEANTTYYGQVRAVGSAGAASGYRALGAVLTSPALPVAAAYTAVANDGFTAHWTANGNSAGTVFEIQMSAAADFSGTVTTSATANTSADFGGLPANTTYYAQVRTVGRGGATTSYVPLGAVITNALMPVPASYSGVTESALTAHWTPNGNPAGTQYEVRSATASDFTGTVTTSATANTSAQFTGLTPNTTYHLQVRTLGGGVSTAYAPLGPVLTLAAQPAADASSSLSETGVTANWTANGNPAGTLYEAQAALTADFTGVVITSTGYGATASFSALSPNTTYYLRVRAVGHGGSATSDIPLGSVLTLAAAPIAAAYSGVGQTALTANWSANGNPAGTLYEVQSSTAPDFTGTVTPTATVGTSASFTGLTAVTTYYLQVRAVGSGGAATVYAPLGAVQTLPFAPAAAAYSAVGSDALTAHWAANGNPSGTVYEAEVASAADFSVSVLASLTTNTGLDVVGLTPNTTYYARVRVRAASASAYAALGSVVTLANAPAATAVTGVSSTWLSVAWATNGNPAGTRYVVSYWSASASTATVATSTASLKVSGLSHYATYYLQVRAENHAGAATAADVTVSTVTKSPPLSSIVLEPGQGGHGEYELPSGLAEMDAPPGAFDEGVTLEMSEPDPIPAESMAGYTRVGVWLRIDTGGRQPRRPVSITLPYTDANVASLDPKKLIVAWYSEPRRAWVPLLSAVDSPGRRVRAQAGHFSVFGLFVAAAAKDLGSAKAFPNPLRPTLGHVFMTLMNLPARSRIRIYTMLGELVRDLAADAVGMANWDGTNSVGEKVASGVYLAFIEGAGHDKTIKLAVQR